MATDEKHRTWCIWALAATAAVSLTVNVLAWTAYAQANAYTFEGVSLSGFLGLVEQGLP
ncbi:hypothetical protein K2X14_14495 [Acetobacter sp. TBRC 12305]|uniref:Uncharacterized protein n=1 Tax=Acetobacter garciniae TaxID=2817435 RepID=A0A939HKR7_9PROT|nr:hypothetical protein [Acetobacter garciniae]MBO1326218.1 hypothetical protein [Acetobacter garciniae]MBX0346045.1 hypothetical protein [Acetobacter garciniae]